VSSMSSGTSHSIERAVITLIVVTLCLRAVADILPAVFIPLAVLGVVFALVRLVLFHTRKW
jgi:hypothetical protein